MVRKRQRRILNIFFGASKIGQLIRAPNGVISFHYDSRLALVESCIFHFFVPAAVEPVLSGEGATSYFDGLLPDSRTVREKIAVRGHAESAGNSSCTSFL